MIDYSVTGFGQSNGQQILLNEELVAKDNDEAIHEFEKTFSEQYSNLTICSILPLDKQERFV